MRRFSLGASEELLHTHSCMHSPAGRTPVPYSLYLTEGYMCLGASLGAHVEKVAWADVEQIRPSTLKKTAMPHSIEASLRSSCSAHSPPPSISYALSP